MSHIIRAYINVSRFTARTDSVVRCRSPIQDETRNTADIAMQMYHVLGEEYKVLRARILKLLRRGVQRRQYEAPICIT